MKNNSVQYACCPKTGRSRGAGQPGGYGGTGRHAGFRFRCREAYRFKSCYPHCNLRDAGMAAIHSRGISAVGSAQHWQCWGQGFESPMLHRKKRRKPLFSCRKLKKLSVCGACGADDTRNGTAGNGAKGIRTERQRQPGTEEMQFKRRVVICRGHITARRAL